MLKKRREMEKLERHEEILDAAEKIFFLKTNLKHTAKMDLICLAIFRIKVYLVLSFQLDP